MCTRFLVSSGGDPGRGIVSVGRTMDWWEDTATVLALRPRGAKRSSAPNHEGGFDWTSEYGSVVALMYGALAVDGLNEKGFQVSALYLTEADYGERDPQRPGIELGLVVQCLLDRFQKVSDAVDWLVQSNVQIIPLMIGEKPGTGHLALADATGDSAVVEYLDGEIAVHEGPEYTVMANSPIYSEQLKLLSRYEGLGGNQPLPGGVSSTDRFARAAYYSRHLPETDNLELFAAQVFSVARNASAPFGVVDVARPYVSTTRWRTVSDLTNLLYFFEETTRPNVVWARLKSLNFEPGPEQILNLDAETVEDEPSGDVSGLFAVR